jgi:hypothetical protein
VVEVANRTVRFGGASMAVPNHAEGRGKNKCGESQADKKANWFLRRHVSKQVESGPKLIVR